MLYDGLVVLKSHLSLVVSGGPSLFADYCTYLVAYTDGICTDANSAPDTMLGEVRGSNSRSVCHFLVIIYSVLFFFFFEESNLFCVMFLYKTPRCIIMNYPHSLQVYGLIISAHRICTRFYDPRKWLLSAQVYQQLFRGIA